MGGRSYKMDKVLYYRDQGVYMNHNFETCLLQFACNDLTSESFPSLIFYG